jgi:hypothetical protein
MLSLVLVLLVSSPDAVKEVSPQNICFLSPQQLKKLRSHGGRENDLTGMVVASVDYEYFTELTMYLEESNEFCRVYAKVFLPTAYANEVSNSGQKISFQGNFLRMTYGRCDKEVSFPSCEMRFAYTK